MRALTMFLLGIGFACLAGCGDSPTTLNTTPLTEEQMAKVSQEDKLIEDEESPNNKTLRAKPKKSK